MRVAALKDDQLDGSGGVKHSKKIEKDVEGQSSCSRSYSRIGPAVGVAADSSSDQTDVEHQIEIEAHAAIKYRTCSWKKVRSPRLTPRALHAKLAALILKIQ